MNSGKNILLPFPPRGLSFPPRGSSSLFVKVAFFRFRQGGLLPFPSRGPSSVSTNGAFFAKGAFRQGGLLPFPPMGHLLFPPRRPSSISAKEAFFDLRHWGLLPFLLRSSSANGAFFRFRRWSPGFAIFCMMVTAADNCRYIRDRETPGT